MARSQGKLVFKEPYEFTGMVVSCLDIVEHIGRTFIVKPNNKKERFYVVRGCPIEMIEDQLFVSAAITSTLMLFGISPLVLDVFSADMHSMKDLIMSLNNLKERIEKEGKDDSKSTDGNGS